MPAAQAISEGLTTAAELHELDRAAAGIGHNSPPPNDDKDGRKAYFVAEIKDWLANRQQRAQDYMRPDEIGVAKDRPFLLLRALLDGLAYISRAKIGAGRAHHIVAVYGIHTCLSDHARGYS